MRMDLLDRLLGHDAWTTRQLLKLSEPLGRDELYRSFEVGHGSLHETFVHMIDDVEVWTSLMNGDEIDRDAVSWDALSVSELIGRHDAASSAFAVLARRVRDEGREDERWFDVLDSPPRE